MPQRGRSPRRHHRTPLHKKRWEATKRQYSLGIAIDRSRKLLANSPADRTRRLLLSSISALSSKQSSEIRTIKSLSRAIKFHRLLKAGTDFEDLAHNPALKWKNEKRLRLVNRTRSHTQFRDDNGVLATSDAAILSGWANYAKT